MITHILFQIYKIKLKCVLGWQANVFAVVVAAFNTQADAVVKTSWKPDHSV